MYYFSLGECCKNDCACDSVDTLYYVFIFTLVCVCVCVCVCPRPTPYLYLCDLTFFYLCALVSHILIIMFRP